MFEVVSCNAVADAIKINALANLLQDRGSAVPSAAEARQQRARGVVRVAGLGRRPGGGAA
jgi:hypothetical protein